MALTNCKECKKEVSTEAAACPHCGVAKPGEHIAVMAAPKTKLSVIEKIGIGVGALILLVAFSTCTSSSEDDAKKAAKKAADEAACRHDLACWGDKHIFTAGVYCQNPIERLAKFSVRWTDSAGDPKLSRYSWLDEEAGTVTYIGDKVEFQNGFGAFQAYSYLCKFDPIKNKVLDVQAYPGRLPIH